MPRDPRDPVLLFRDDPDPPLHLVVSATPRLEEAQTAATVHRAKEAQKADREQAITATLPDAARDLAATQVLDSIHAGYVMDVLPSDLPANDRHQAGAVAVRLHDEMWNRVRSYRVAVALLRGLRRAFVAHGINGTVTDRDMAGLAEELARSAHLTALQTWDGTQPVTAREWATARLGLLSLKDER